MRNAQRIPKPLLLGAFVVLLHLILLFPLQVGSQSPSSNASTVQPGSPVAAFDLDKDREHIASLEGLWRFHTGDDMQWASPGFDDSAWPLIRSYRSWTRQGYPTYSGYAWYRFTVRIPSRSGPQALLLPWIYTGYQVYANGTMVGGLGSIQPTLAPVFASEVHSFPIPVALLSGTGPQTIHFAIRVWEYRPIVSWVGAGTLGGGAEFGDARLIAQDLQLEQDYTLLDRVNRYAYFVLAIVVGLTILALFLFRRQDFEYLWFALLLLLGAADAALEIHGYGAMRFLVFRFMDEATVALGVMAAVAFFSIVLHLRRSRTWWFVCCAVALSPLSVALYYLQWTPIPVSYSLQLACLLPAYFWIVIALSICTFKGDPSAKLLLAPASLLYGYSIFNSIYQITSEAGWRSGFTIPGPLFFHPYPLHPDEITHYIFVLALLIFLVRRFSLGRREEERLSGEFAAARSVQSLLIPDRAPDTPGFSVQSVYLPANEVGGDFFQVIPLEDCSGSVLLAIGDVSGKGLPAALMVSLLVGTLRQAAESSKDPAEILASLNQRLHERSIGGFATCLIVRANQDGGLTIANAGHLSPYSNGIEIPVESGLPLGILPNAVYAKTIHRLSPDESLTLLTDGVIESRNSSGELFGFDRTKQISQGTAAEIAQTAKSFGQDDDITVLKLTRIPVVSCA